MLNDLHCFDGVVVPDSHQSGSGQNVIPPKELKKIFQGWVKAVAWSQDPANWQAYMDILNSVTFKGDAPYSEAELRVMVEAVRIHDPAGLFVRNQDGGGLQQYLQTLKAFLTANNLLKKDFTPEAIFQNQAIVEVLHTPH